MPSSSTERPPSEAQTVAAAYAYSAQHQARKGGWRDLRGVPDRCCPEGMCPEVGGTVMEEGSGQGSGCFLFVLVCVRA